MPSATGSSSSSRGGSSSSKKNELGATEKRIYQGVLDAPGQSLYQEEVMKRFADVEADKMLLSINSLLKKSLFSLHQTDRGPRYTAITKKEASVLGSLDGDETIVYHLIKDSGTEGLWTHHLRKRSNLHETPMKRAITSLESRELIKRIYNVKFPTRRIYILFHLTPSTEVSGGNWYTENDFDTAFVTGISNVCLQYIRHQTWPKGGSTALYPSSHAKHLPTAPQILQHLTQQKVTHIQLNLQDIEDLLETLVFDEKIEKVPMLGGLGGPLSLDDSDEKKRKSRKSRSDDDDDSDSNDSRRGKATAKKRSSSSSRKSKTKDSAKQKQRKKKRRRHSSEDDSESESESESGSGSGSSSDSASDSEDDTSDGESRKRKKKSSKSSKSKKSSSSSSRKKKDKSKSSKSKGKSRSRSRSKRSRHSSDDDESESSSDSESGSDSDDDGSTDSDESSGSDGHRSRKSNSKKAKSRVLSSESEAASDDDDEEGDPTFATNGATSASSLYVYRALRHVSVPLGFTETPCARCPVFDFCRPKGPVNAEECVYYDQWIKAGLEDDEEEGSEEEEEDQQPRGHGQQQNHDQEGVNVDQDEEMGGEEEHDDGQEI